MTVVPAGLSVGALRADDELIGGEREPADPGRCCRGGGVAAASVRRRRSRSSAAPSGFGRRGFGRGDEGEVSPGCRRARNSAGRNRSSRASSPRSDSMRWWKFQYQSALNSNSPRSISTRYGAAPAKAVTRQPCSSRSTVSSNRRVSVSGSRGRCTAAAVPDPAGALAAASVKRT